MSSVLAMLVTVLYMVAGHHGQSGANVAKHVAWVSIRDTGHVPILYRDMVATIVKEVPLKLPIVYVEYVRMVTTVNLHSGHLGVSVPQIVARGFRQDQESARSWTQSLV